MSLTLYAHPFSSYCWKVLVPMWENDLAFDYRNLADEAANAEWQELSPFGKLPLMVDDGEVVLEASIIIEHFHLRHRGPVPMLPDDPVAALEVRLLDRLSDNYLMAPTQAIVADFQRDPDQRDPVATDQARAMLDKAYAWWDAHMAGREWAANAFGLADCATGPALFYADWVHPIPDEHRALRAYRARLLARPSIERAVDEARPYRGLFPPGAPDRD